MACPETCHCIYEATSANCQTLSGFCMQDTVRSVTLSMSMCRSTAPFCEILVFSLKTTAFYGLSKAFRFQGHWGNIWSKAFMDAGFVIGRLNGLWCFHNIQLQSFCFLDSKVLHLVLLKASILKSSHTWDPALRLPNWIAALLNCFIYFMEKRLEVFDTITTDYIFTQAPANKSKLKPVVRYQQYTNSTSPHIWPSSLRSSTYIHVH